MPTSKILESGKVPGTLLFVGSNLLEEAKRFAAQLIGKKADGHPDVHIYLPEGKSGMHSIDNMRQFIDEMPLPPFVAPVKVFIIDEAERMLPTSSNALLKTCEEPPPDTCIILLSSEPEALLPTILSRCRKVIFTTTRPLSEQQALIDLLSRQKSYPELLQALTDLESLQPKEEESIAKWTDNLLEGILYWYRDRHLLAAGADHNLLHYRTALEQLESCKTDPLPPLERLISQLATCRLALQRHLRLRTCLQHLFASI
jgi:DNA polymerase III delta prime subunit